MATAPEAFINALRETAGANGASNALASMSMDMSDYFASVDPTFSRADFIEACSDAIPKSEED